MSKEFEKLAREEAKQWCQSEDAEFRFIKGASFGFDQGVESAIDEVKGWRELTIKAYRETSVTNPDEYRRETQNTLNLLDVIISKLRKKAGEDPASVFHDIMKTWEKVGYPLETSSNEF